MTRRRALFVRLWPLLAILLLAAALRVAFLWKDVPPLFADEIEQYVSIQSIVATGHDVDGKLEPLLYSRIGRNPPLYGIAGYLSTLVFGNDPFGWRFPAALFGLASVALTYLFVRELTGRRPIALSAALLMAVAPDQIHFSRIGWEPATELPVVLGVLWLLLRAVRVRGRPLPLGLLGGAAVLAGLSPYAYPATPLYVVLLGGALLALHPVVFREPPNRIRLLGATAVALALATPVLWLAATDPHTTERSAHINTFASGINGASLRTFAINYASHFGREYLFTIGPPDQRYLGGCGALFWWYGPLIVAGLLFLFQYARSRALGVWVWIWLAIYPLAGALTDDGHPHPPRTLSGIPVLCALAAIGAYALLIALKRIARDRGRVRYYRIAALSLSAAGVVVSLWWFCVFYFVDYPKMSAGAWESGAREAFAAVRARESRYARLCLEGFNYFHTYSLVRYFLPNSPLRIYENAENPACTERSTLFLTTWFTPVPGFHSVGITYDLTGEPFAALEARDP